jgi:subtilisin family serine protease
VIDSGVDAQHPELAGPLARACVVRKPEGGEIRCTEIAAEQSTDAYGHGTAVASAIAAIAPGARLASVKVLNEYNSCSGDELIAGLRWALDQQFRLINMSLATSKPAFQPQLQELCEQAYVQDAIVVASRRNFGDLGMPAMFSSVISVDREDFPDRFLLRYLPHSRIEFAAHGTNVRLAAPGGGYALQTGTSFATPVVTGIVALLLEAFPGLLPWEAKTLLRSLARS